MGDPGQGCVGRCPVSVTGFHTGKGRWHRSFTWAKLAAAGAASGAGGPEKTDTVQLVQVGVPEAPLVQGLEGLLVALLGQEGLRARRDNL